MTEGRTCRDRQLVKKKQERIPRKKRAARAAQKLRKVDTVDHVAIEQIEKEHEMRQQQEKQQLYLRENNAPPHTPETTADHSSDSPQVEARSPDGEDESLQEDLPTPPLMMGNVQESDMGAVLVYSEHTNDFCTEFAPYENWQAMDVTTMPRYFTVNIPSFRHREDGYVVFKIEVQACGRQYHIERRFSEFYRLAEVLEDNGIMKGWTLPPKTWFRPTDFDFLESRRVGLVSSLYKLLSIPGMLRLGFLRDFLQLDMFELEVNRSDY